VLLTAALSVVLAVAPANVVPWSTQQLTSYWKQYAAPAVVEYQGTRTTPCGTPDEANAFYCRLDKTVYVDDALVRRLRDYAAVAVLAHEWGHAVQDQTGTLSWALDHRYYLGKELQADCYAGTFTRWASKRKLLAKGDYKEAVAMLDEFGDFPFLYDRFSPGAHGTSPQRIAWFTRGYKGGNPKVCATVYSVWYGATPPG
jgi:predicted metalloprotease